MIILWIFLIVFVCYYLYWVVYTYRDPKFGGSILGALYLPLFCWCVLLFMFVNKTIERLPLKVRIKICNPTTYTEIVEFENEKRRKKNMEA